MTGRVAWISIAPVKGPGLGLVARDAVNLTPEGVVQDRRFHVIDDRGRMVNGRRLGTAPRTPRPRIGGAGSRARRLDLRGYSQPMGRSAGMVVLLAVAGLLASSDTPAGARPASIRVDSPVAARFSCQGWGLPFRLKALEHPKGFERRDGPLARALNRFLAAHAGGFFGPRHGWFRIVRRGRHAQVGHGRRARDLLLFTRGRSGWRWDGSGSCRPRAYRHGLTAVGWWLPRGEEPSPDATELTVLVQEDNCASGHDATGRVLPPWVHYGRRKVTVTYHVRPRRGAQDCQGVPPTRVRLRLDEPLGDRALRDGGRPPRSIPRQAGPGHWGCPSPGQPAIARLWHPSPR